MAQVLWNADIDVYNDKVIPFSVARTISWYLEVPALLRFQLVSKNAYKAVRDPRLWIDKLRKMGVYSTALEDPSDNAVPEPNIQPEVLVSSSGYDFSTLRDPLQCLDRIYKAPKLARFQVLQILLTLKDYYKDLQSNTAYNQLRIFKAYQTPEDQARLLGNLKRYNAMDIDEVSKKTVAEKIADIMEIFENALLRELEIHFDLQEYEKAKEFVAIMVELKNDQTLIDFFLQKVCFDNDNIRFMNAESLGADDFYVQERIPSASTSELESEAEPGLVSNHQEMQEEIGKAEFKVNMPRFDELVLELSTTFNHLSQIVDVIFPTTVPMMLKISEELITNQLQEILLMLIRSGRERSVYLEVVPLLYRKLAGDFLRQLVPSQNIGEHYISLVHGLIDVSYDSYVADYISEEKMTFKQKCEDAIREWSESLEKREAQTSENILRHVKVETKNDFLRSFRKVFTINASGDNATNKETGVANYSMVQAHAKILEENLKSLTELFSPELALRILQAAKSSLGRLLSFQDFTINSILTDVHAAMQDEFLMVLQALGNEHLKLGFDKSLAYLKEYDPHSLSSLDQSSFGGTSAIAPLTIFFKLIHMADIIVQMMDIFYKEEMIHKNVVKNENSVLNPSLQAKRKVEAMVDKFVADGLNIGIDVLFKEIESVFISLLKDVDYNPEPGSLCDGPTLAAKKAVLILADNIDLLEGSAEKSVVEVFQQEVAERFFQTIVKVLKRSVISVDGAVLLISDLNLYYDFILLHIKSNKRMIYPLFQALKKVGQIYLIGGEDSKSIGRLVSDLSKFNGIFSQEEIYEFVQRRLDWNVIKKDVEKVMYGLSLGDCAIM